LRKVVANGIASTKKSQRRMSENPRSRKMCLG
jgi:hypothetical protein